MNLADNGAQLEAGPNDVFIFETEEDILTKARWATQDVINAGFYLLEDRTTSDNRVIGSSTAIRRLVFRAPPRGTYDFCLPLRRLFAQGDPSSCNADEFRISISTIGSRQGNSSSMNTVMSSAMH